MPLPSPRLSRAAFCLAAGIGDRTARRYVARGLPALADEFDPVAAVAWFDAQLGLSGRRGRAEEWASVAAPRLRALAAAIQAGDEHRASCLAALLHLEAAEAAGKVRR